MLEISTFSKSYISVSGFSVEDIHLRCEAIVLDVEAPAIAIGRNEVVRIVLEYCATLDRKAQEFDARATALSRVLFDAISVVVKIDLYRCGRDVVKSRSKLESPIHIRHITGYMH
jgi:hypothetical protein